MFLKPRKWYKDPDFYKGLLDWVLNSLIHILDFCITLEIAIRYLQFRGIL